jgi:ERCC4-type nuclease
MTIQIDSREHKWELARIQRQLTALGCKTIVSKLYVGDYQSLDNPRLVIDRKKDLLELCGNVTQQHERFQRELIKAQEAGIRLIILIEHGGDIQSLEDVYFWDNPRLLQSPKATTGKGLYKSLCTIRNRYNVRFEFCTKQETGKKIMELLDG